MELLSTSDADRPRGVKVTENSEVSTITENNDEISTPSQSGLKRTRRSTQQEKEEAMLPNLKPAPGI